MIIYIVLTWLELSGGEFMWQDHRFTSAPDEAVKRKGSVLQWQPLASTIPMVTWMHIHATDCFSSHSQYGNIRLVVPRSSNQISFGITKILPSFQFTGESLCIFNFIFLSYTDQHQQQLKQVYSSPSWAKHVITCMIMNN